MHKWNAPSQHQIIWSPQVPTLRVQYSGFISWALQACVSRLIQMNSLLVRGSNLWWEKITAGLNPTIFFFRFSTCLLLLQLMIDPPGKLIRRWNEHTGSSLSLSFSPSLRLFLSHSLWHTNTLTPPNLSLPPSLPPPSQSHFRSGLLGWCWLDSCMQPHRMN